MIASSRSWMELPRSPVLVPDWAVTPRMPADQPVATSGQGMIVPMGLALAGPLKGECNIISVEWGI